MAYFNKGGDRGGNSGGSRFGGRDNDRGGRPSFGAKKSFGNAFGARGGSQGGRGGFGDREVTMHDATCAECGKPCQVPFRPTQGKPVYCKDCYGLKGGQENRDDRFPRKEFKKDFSKDFNVDRPARPSFDAPRVDPTATQLEMVNAKLERLIKIVESLVKATVGDEPQTLGEMAEIEQAEAPVAKKKAAKKSK